MPILVRSRDTQLARAAGLGRVAVLGEAWDRFYAAFAAKPE